MSDALRPTDHFLKGSAMKRFFLQFLCVLNVATVPVVHAEKADSAKDMTIDADDLVGNDRTQVRTYTGNVVVTRGTLLLKADKMILTTDPAGYNAVTLLATPGKIVSYRQKRDGGENLWMEGEAERIDYDEKTEILKLITKASLRQLEGNKPSQEVQGAFISYDSRSEDYKVSNAASGESKIGAGRVKSVLNPRTTTDQKGK
jgi:lipopolysaccharide export system protein LptA